LLFAFDYRDLGWWIGAAPFEGGVWSIHVELPEQYPYKSPSIGFMNKIFHPNIDEQWVLSAWRQLWLVDKRPFQKRVCVFGRYQPDLVADVWYVLQAHVKEFPLIIYRFRFVLCAPLSARSCVSSAPAVYAVIAPFGHPAWTPIAFVYDASIAIARADTCITPSLRPPELINIFESFLPQLLRYPNAADPLNGEAAALFMRSPDDYARKVREHVKRYAGAKDAQDALDKGGDEEHGQSGEEEEEEEMSDMGEMSDDEAAGAMDLWFATSIGNDDGLTTDVPLATLACVFPLVPFLLSHPSPISSLRNPIFRRPSHQSCPLDRVRTYRHLSMYQVHSCTRSYLANTYRQAWIPLLDGDLHRSDLVRDWGLLLSSTVGKAAPAWQTQVFNGVISW
jgi:ubiquitin-protein ligase